MFKVAKFNYFLCLLLSTFALIITIEQLNVQAENLQHHQLKSTEQLAINQEDDLDFMTNLALIKGHLIVGKELLELKEYQEAEPHFGHPVDEIYGLLAPQLSARNLPDFKKSLTVLHELVKFTPQDPKVMTQYQLVMRELDQVIATFPDSQLKSPQFILKVINNLLATTEEEYSAAIIDNRVVENVEYQDSRGFVLYSLDLYENIANPQLNREIRPILLEIKSAFPTPMPPNPVVKSPQTMTSLVKQFEQKIK